MEDLVEEACKRMQAGLASLKQAAPPRSFAQSSFAPAAAKQQIAAAAENVKREVSKVGLMWGGELAPTVTEARALLRDFQESVLQLCAIYNSVRIAAGAGPTLALELRSRANAVVNECQGFLAVVSAHGDSSLHRLAGRALEAADAGKKPALDNRTAIGRALTSVLTGAHDALREAKELATQPHQGEEPSGGQPGAGSPDADFEPDPCSAQEFQVVEASVAMVEVTVSLLRISTRALLHDGGGPALPETRDDWENLLFHCRPLDTIVNDLVAGLYPPQEGEDLRELSAALKTCCELLIAEFPTISAENVSEHLEQVEASEKRLEESYDALVTALA